MNRTKYVVVFWIVVWAVPFLLGGLLLYRWVYREDYLLRALDSGTATESEAAAAKLADLGSLRALPRLLRLIEVKDLSQHPDTGEIVAGKPGLGYFTIDAGDAGYLDAAWRIARVSGADSVPILSKQVSSVELGVRVLAVFLLGELGPRAKAAEPFVIETASTQAEPIVRLTADQALRKIRGEEELLMKERS